MKYFHPSLEKGLCKRTRKRRREAYRSLSEQVSIEFGTSLENLPCPVVETPRRGVSTSFIHKGQRYTGSFGQVSQTVAKKELARKKAVAETQKHPHDTVCSSLSRPQTDGNGDPGEPVFGGKSRDFSPVPTSTILHWLAKTGGCSLPS
jgi:hypothetical protein